MWNKYPEILAELIEVDQLIKTNINSRNKLLSDTAEKLIEAGGKRLRPAFVILAAKFGNYQREKVLHMAGAIEILHTATLVHDDIIDKSPMRRGLSTVASSYGVDMAVYVGDFLYTRAIMMLSKEIPVENLEMIARALKAICEGEVDQYEARFKINTSIVSYLKRISRKTAVLFSAACAAGAFLADVEKETVKKISKFGYYFGMAFQIRDDIKDFSSNEQKEGKPVRNDLQQGDITLPVIYALRENLRNDKAMSLFTDNGLINHKDIDKLGAVVKKSKGIARTNKMLNKYIKRGRKVLNEIPDNKYRTIMMELLNSLNV